jgi:hypothetical protein
MYSAEINSKYKFNSAPSVEFFRRGGAWKPKYIEYTGWDIELYTYECIDTSIYEMRYWTLGVRMYRLHKGRYWTKDVRVYRYIDIWGAMLNSKCRSVSIYRYTSRMVNAKCTSVSITRGAIWNSRYASVSKYRYTNCDVSNVSIYEETAQPVFHWYFGST